MTPPVDVDRFRVEYRRAVTDIARFITPERQQVIARHNLGLAPSRTDLSTYLTASEERYARALGLFNAHDVETDGDRRALEVGGFLGAFPLALSRLGIAVTLAEVFGYYGGALDDLSHFLASEGVEILDVDFTRPVDEPVTQRFAIVTNMAMLEHLADSPETLMRNLRSVTDDGGAVLIEVPNIAYWPNRLNLLRGRSIHPPLDVLFGSASPFLGHHREYTRAELNDLLRWTGFRSVAFEQFNYSMSFSGGRLIHRLYPLGVQLLPTLLFRNCRELIMVLAVPDDSG